MSKKTFKYQEPTKEIIDLTNNFLNVDKLTTDNISENTEKLLILDFTTQLDIYNCIVDEIYISNDCGESNLMIEKFLAQPCFLEHRTILRLCVEDELSDLNKMELSEFEKKYDIVIEVE